MKLPKAPDMKTNLDDSRQAKYRYERIWDLCLLYLRGKQHVTLDTRSRTFVDVRYPNGQTKVVINRLLNGYRNLLAKLSMAYPGMTVLPASPSPDDITKAEAAEQALKYIWNADDVAATLEQMAAWTIATGNCGLQTFYDPDDDAVHIKSIAPFDVFYEGGVTSYEETRWAAVRTFVHRDDLAEAYPDEKEYIKKLASNTGGSSPMSQGRRFLAFGGDDSQINPKDRLEVFEIYTRGGDTAIMAGDRYLFKGKWTGKHLPVQLVRYTNVPGELWGMGYIQPLIEIQDLYNRARAQVIDIIENHGWPKWVVPRTSGINKQSITKAAGEKIYYNASGGPPPTQITPPPLPMHMLDNIRQLTQEIDDIGGLHATSLGKRAVGIESGKAIDALAANDMTQLQVTQRNIEKAVKIMAETSLLLMKEYYKEDKMLRMLDQTGKVVWSELQLTSLQDDPEVFLEAGTLFRDEKQDRDQKVIELLQLGLIDQKTAMRELDFKTGRSWVIQKMQSQSHARELLQGILDGYPIEIFPSDDLETIEQVFVNFVQNEEYYALDDERQQYIRDVVIALQTFGREDEDVRKQLLERTVFPPRTPAPQDMTKLAASMGSMEGAGQASEQMMDHSLRKADRARLDEALPDRGDMAGFGG